MRKLIGWICGWVHLLYRDRAQKLEYRMSMLRAEHEERFSAYDRLWEKKRKLSHKENKWWKRKMYYKYGDTYWKE